MNSCFLFFFVSYFAEGLPWLGSTLTTEGDAGLTPGRGTKMPLGMERLSSCTATTGVVSHNYRVCAQ